MRTSTQITQVTIHRDGAWVVRSGHAPTGIISVFDLPLLHEAQALEVVVAGGAAVDVTEVAALRRPRDGELLRVLRGVRFDLLVAAPSADFHLRYFVPAARWTPTYAMSIGAHEARIRVDALVAQATGEDWSDAVVRVCTTIGLGGAAPVGLRGTGPVGPPEVRLTAELWRMLSRDGGAPPPDWLRQIAVAEAARVASLRAARIPDGGRTLPDRCKPVLLGGGRFDVPADGIWRALPVDEIRVARQAAPADTRCAYDPPPVPLPAGPLRVYEDGQLVLRTLLRPGAPLVIPHEDTNATDDAPTLIGGVLTGADGRHSGALPTLIEVSPPVSMLAAALFPDEVPEAASVEAPTVAPGTPVPIELPVGRRSPTLEVAHETSAPPAACASDTERPQRSGSTTLLALDELTVDEEANERALFEFLFGTQQPADPGGAIPLASRSGAGSIRRAGDLARGAREPEARLAGRHTRKVRAFG